MADFLPRASAAAVDNGGRFTRETYDALRRAFDSLSSRQTELETAQAAITAILGSLGAASVEELQDLGNLLDGKQDASEVLDALSDILTDGIVVKHGPTAYGRSMGESDTIEWANASGTAGNPTPSLKDFADSGTGTFKLLTRDAKGRLSGTADGDTDDVPEGVSNLYFTAQRVRDTVLNGLSTATNAVIAATDTVLSALGKLQAQISGLIVQTITDGDTTHAPSGDAVFDAMAGKFDKAGGTVTGATTFTASPLDVAPASGSAQVRVNSVSSVSDLVLQSSGVTKWLFRKNSSEDFEITALGGAGTALLVPHATGHLWPGGTDNTKNLGDAARRWKEVFSGNATINTSDAREKRIRGPLTRAEIAAAREIKTAIVMYQWHDAIAEKGEDARLHCSPTVQAVIGIMEKHGLDPFRYGFVCYDQWDETPEATDPETGEVTQEYRPAGDRYSLRPTELLFFIMAAI